MFNKRFLVNILIFVALLVSASIYADVPNEIRYNGKLKEYRTEVNGVRNINFKIYDTISGGTAKWESGNKSITVSSGIFTTVLSPDTSLVDWREKDYYLEVEIDGKKLEPREKLTSVPYSLHSNTAENIIVQSDGEFSVKLGDSKKFAVDKNDAKFINSDGIEFYMVPKGAIVIWSGASDKIPAGWSLCDGSNGTPNLTDKFVIGAGNDYSVGATGGEKEHVLTIDEMPSHSHKYYTGKGEESTNSGRPANSQYETIVQTLSTELAGNDIAHNNMPPYYSLCYIMKR